MDKKYLYIGGGVAALGVVGVGIYFATRKKAPATLATAPPVKPRDMTLQDTPPRQNVAPGQQQNAPPPPPPPQDQRPTPAQQANQPPPQQAPMKLPQLFWSDKNNKTRAANSVQELRHAMWKEYDGNMSAMRMAMVFYDPKDPRMPPGYRGAWVPASFLAFPLSLKGASQGGTEAQFDDPAILAESSMNDDFRTSGLAIGSVHSTRWLVTSGPSQGVGHAAGANELHNLGGLGRNQHRRVFMPQPVQALALSEMRRRRSN